MRIRYAECGPNGSAYIYSIKRKYESKSIGYWLSLILLSSGNNVIDKNKVKSDKCEGNKEEGSALTTVELFNRIA